MRRAALVVGLLVASVLAGGAIATSPHNENGPCSVAPSGWPVPEVVEGWSGGARMALWPPGVRCVYSAGSAPERAVFIRPTKAETLAVIGLIALVLFAAARRPAHAAARGAVVAVAFLALFSFFSWYGGDFAASMMGSFLVWSLAFVVVGVLTRSATDALTLTILVPTIVFFAWAIPFFMELGHVATLTGIAAGALANVGIERAIRLGRRLLPANELATTN